MLDEKETVAANDRELARSDLQRPHKRNVLIVSVHARIALTSVEKALQGWLQDCNFEQLSKVQGPKEGKRFFVVFDSGAVAKRRARHAKESIVFDDGTYRTYRRR